MKFYSILILFFLTLSEGQCQSGYATSQELEDLFKLCSPENFKNVAPYWPNINKAVPFQFDPKDFGEFTFNKQEAPVFSKRPYPKSLMATPAPGLKTKTKLLFMGPEAAAQALEKWKVQKAEKIKKRQQDWDEKEASKVNEMLAQFEKDEQRRLEKEKKSWEKKRDEFIDKQRKQWNKTHTSYKISSSISNQKYIGREALPHWIPTLENGFTSPYEHKKSGPFQYTVHGICETQLGDKLAYDLQKIKDLHLSVSLVNDKKSSTYSHHGLILRIHPNLLYATSCANMSRCGAPVQNMNYKFGIQTPQKLMQASYTVPEGKNHAHNMLHNELSVLGSNSKGNKVEIIGLFARRTQSTHSPAYSQMSKSRLNYLKDLCVKKSWPVIPLD